MGKEQTQPLSFGDATRIEQITDSEFRAHVPEGWQQGRGAFCGLVIGLCLRALDAVEDTPERPLRSASLSTPPPPTIPSLLLSLLLAPL